MLEMTQVEKSAPKALAEREQTVSKALAEMSTKKESVSDFINILDDSVSLKEVVAFAPEQTDIKEIANGYQRGNKEITEQVTIEQQTYNKPTLQPTTVVQQNLQQTYNAEADTYNKP